MTKRLLAEPDDGCPASPIRLFLPPDASADPDRLWYDVGPDRHHVAIFALSRRAEALALSPLWTVLRGPVWYICCRVETGGAEVLPT